MVLTRMITGISVLPLDRCSLTRHFGSHPYAVLALEVNWRLEPTRIVAFIRALNSISVSTNSGNFILRSLWPEEKPAKRRGCRGGDTNGAYSPHFVSEYLTRWSQPKTAKVESVWILAVSSALGSVITRVSTMGVKLL